LISRDAENLGRLDPKRATVSQQFGRDRDVVGFFRARERAPVPIEDRAAIRWDQLSLGEPVIFLRDAKPFQTIERSEADVICADE
jgi:hypothetical protein